jgi:hypothetical protein
MEEIDISSPSSPTENSRISPVLTIGLAAESTSLEDVNSPEETSRFLVTWKSKLGHTAWQERELSLFNLFKVLNLLYIICLV